MCIYIYTYTYVYMRTPWPPDLRMGSTDGGFLVYPPCVLANRLFFFFFYFFLFRWIEWFLHRQNTSKDLGTIFSLFFFFCQFSDYAYVYVTIRYFELQVNQRIVDKFRFIFKRLWILRCSNVGSRIWVSYLDRYMQWRYWKKNFKCKMGML